MRWVPLCLLIFESLLGISLKATPLCNNIELKEGELRLSRNEEVLVCGSTRGQDGWQDIPLPQAEYQLRVLLGEKGYFKPRFERDGQFMKVWSGPRSKVEGIKILGADDYLDGSRLRKVVDEPLTPELLDRVNGWADTGLRSQGFACPEVGVKGQAWDNLIAAQVTPGHRQTVSGVELHGFGSLDREAMARYQAFEAGDLYDVRETQLTVNRMLAGGLLQSAYFTSECRGDQVDLHLWAVVGEPRLLTFGVGATTEEFPFLDIRFRNTRLDDRASSLTARLHASPLEQSLELSTELYVLPWSKRTYFGPRAQVARHSERAYEFLQVKAGADLGRRWELWDTRLNGRVGPTLNYVNTVQGLGPDDVYYLSWEGSLLGMNHIYELYMRDQYEGWMAEFGYRGQRKGIGSYLNVDRYEIDYKYLWNIGAYAPPLFILAARLEAVAVNANPIDLRERRSLLPLDYRVFYGGDSNLRGFPRQSLSNGDVGYMTALYAGFELRLIEQLRWRLEPFLLLDLAKLGDERFRTDKPLYTSTGLGLRWPSPFGTLRGSAAKGRILDTDPTSRDYPEEWVLFLSFGQEF